MIKIETLTLRDLLTWISKGMDCSDWIGNDQEERMGEGRVYKPVFPLTPSS